MKYFVLGYVQHPYDPKRPPRPEVMVRDAFPSEAEARAYASEVHKSYAAFVVATVEGDWAEQIAAEYDKVQRLQEQP